MCGINGIFAYRDTAAPVSRAELKRSREQMAARGPDGDTEWFSQDGRVGFGHRRLSIIDLSPTGAQPMQSADGALTIVFNGEIYNYWALREGLLAKGYSFRGTSDTEVLLTLYADKGEAMLGDLRGMFTIAIWDEPRRRLFLARDPYGIKPLYYADDGGALRFASQVKALLAGGAISREPEPAGQVGFYLWGSVPEPWTTFRAIRALPAGAFTFVDAQGMQAPRRHHSLAAELRQAEAAAVALPAEEASEQIRAALLDSVRHHLVADVPVGAFLSAGIDSGALVGLMRDAGQSDIQTITLAFAEFEGRADNEAPLAAKVAELYGARHTTRVVTEQEFQADLPLILEAMDQPTVDGINTWFVSKAAHEAGLKVAISGLGGDELFGGYPSFRDIPSWVAKLAAPSRIPFAGAALRHAVSLGAPLIGAHPKAAGMLELGGRVPGAYLLRRGVFMPWELREVLDRDTVREGLQRLRPLEAVEAELAGGPKSAFGQVATLEAALYMRNQLLRDSDWASMAHSLEVRVPLVDPELLRRVAPHVLTRAGARGKTDLALAPTQPLPDAVVRRAKTGFSTPIATWLERNHPTARPGRYPTPWARRWAREVAGLAA
ncbi:MAG TPA: asparagine synthase (glutamine-hydrolyzing) [Caulobacteraceae bacterium]